MWYALLAILMVIAIWNMARRRGGVVIKRQDPAFDPAEGQPQVHEALGLLKATNWGGATALYGRLAPSDRYHLVQGLGEVAGLEVIAWPDDPDSALLVTRAGIQMAAAMKAIRTAAERRSRTGIAGGLEGFLESRKLLAEAALRNAHDSTNYALQIRNEMFGHGDASLLNGLLGRIDASEEANIFAALNHVLFLSPLARGTIEGMWRAANDYASNGPNAAWLAIAARAHIEEWVFSMKADKSLTASYVARLQDDGFIEHIRKLDREFWRRATQAQMSRAEAHVAHNHFTFLLKIVRQDELAGPHLEQIGPYIAADPWRYLPDGATRPTRLLSEMRRAAGLRELAPA